MDISSVVIFFLSCLYYANGKVQDETSPKEKETMECFKGKTREGIYMKPEGLNTVSCIKGCAVTIQQSRSDSDPAEVSWGCAKEAESEHFLPRAPQTCAFTIYGKQLYVNICLCETPLCNGASAAHILKRFGGD